MACHIESILREKNSYYWDKATNAHKNFLGMVQLTGDNLYRAHPSNLHNTYGALARSPWKKISRLSQKIFQFIFYSIEGLIHLHLSEGTASYAGLLLAPAESIG